MKDRVLITGYKGYLATHIQDNINLDYIIFDGDTADISNWEKYYYTNVKYVMHFGSVGSVGSNLDRYSDKEIQKSIINSINNAILYCNATKSILIEASSEAILYNGEDSYTKYKKESHVRVLNSCDKYISYIIPRVYSKDRNTGVIRKLKDSLVPLHDMNNIVNYINIKQFIKQFKKELYYNKNKVVRFKDLHRSTLKTLKETYGI